MTRTLENLIPPMNFILIKDFIYALLVSERDNQKTIAAAAPYNFTDEEIRQRIDFGVYKDTFKAADAEELPAIFINTGDLGYPSNGSYAPVGKYKESIEFKVACFAVGTATGADETDPDYTADQNASMRLNYLVSQALGILCASINWKKQAGLLIEVPTLQSIQLVEAPEGKNEAEVIMGREITFMLRTTEKFEAAPTIPLKEIYGTLQIEDGNIDPFFRYLYNQE